MSILGAHMDSLARIESREITGAVAAVRGLSVVVDELPLPVGALVRLEPSRAHGPVVYGEVIGFRDAQSVVMLYNNADGISPGTRVIGEQAAPLVDVGRSLLGRVLDGLGRPIDGRPFPRDTVARPLNPPPARALDRTRIAEPLPTGIRSIDAMATLGKGQRIGIFAGAGIGKSTLLASIARNTAASVNVIALIGERGREVRDFIETALGEEGLARSVLVVATSDESPLLRVRAASVACAIAEHFRDLSSDVMLMMDSITRFAQAQRQIGLTVGEPPATKGYTPSVFALMPRILERAGAIDNAGSITGLYAVLVEGDDINEPISDAARGILDGHIALSRTLATRGHYPAVDVLESISRVADDVCDEYHRGARRVLRRIMAAYAQAEELITIGAYARGSNRDCDVAIEMKLRIDAFLQQPTSVSTAYPETCRELIEIAHEAEATVARLAAAPVPPFVPTP